MLSISPQKLDVFLTLSREILTRLLKTSTKCCSFLSYVRFLEYAVMVWDPNTKILINKLEAIQNRAVFYNSYGYEISVADLKHSLSWDTVQLRQTFSRCLFLKRIGCEEVATDRYQYLHPPTYVPRQRDKSRKIADCSCRTSALQASFSPRSIRVERPTRHCCCCPYRVVFHCALAALAHGHSMA